MKPAHLIKDSRRQLAQRLAMCSCV